MRARIVTGESAGTHCFAPLIPVHRDIRCPYPQSRGPMQGDGQSHRQGGTSTREMGQDSKHAASKQRADPREGKDISRQGVRDARAPIQLAIDRLDQAAQHRSRYVSSPPRLFNLLVLPTLYMVAKFDDSIYRTILCTRCVTVFVP